MQRFSEIQYARPDIAAYKRSLEEYAEKLKECKRSGMTTVTEEEVNKLIQEVKNHNENTIG